MPKLVYDDQKSPEERFGVPPGSYRARFKGTEDRPPFEGPGRFGKTNNGPRLAWFFEVVEPASHKGQVFSQTTGAIPAGPKSGFTKILKGLLGRLPAKGENLDTDDFVGNVYTVEVEENPESESGNLHISHMKPAPGQPVSALPASASPAAQPHGKPAAPKAPARPTTPAPAPLPGAKQPDPEPVYWFSYDGGEPLSATATEVRREIQAGIYKPELLQWSHPGSPDNWQPVAGSWLMDPNQQPPF